MSDINNWWHTWAPYWEHMENQHFSTHIAEKILHTIEGPVLVIGAGMGLIVDFLKKRGFEAYGLDLDPLMISMAHEKRGLQLINADARKLPLKKNSHKTIIISSGVVDFIDDNALIKEIIQEAIRVLAPNGLLYISFYKNNPVVEKINRRLGILTDTGELKLKRLFDIQEMVKDQPLECVPKIVEWTGKGYLPTLLYFIRLGLFLPKELKKYQDRVDRVYISSEKDNVGRKELISSVPESITYRNEDEIVKLLGEIGFYYSNLQKYDDCIVVSYVKSSLLHEKMNEKPVEERGSDYALKIDSVSKKYKNAHHNALESISLQIKEGIIFGILGPNGAGKTTAFSIISGLMKMDRGTISFGSSLKGKKLKSIMGYVPQELALYPDLTARENLNYFGSLYRISGKKLNDKINDLLEMISLTDRADDYVKNYSTGMMRRLNLAAGLIHDPEIILMDEPTVGIDPQSRNCIFEAINKLRNTGVTILYSTHYMEEAMKLCDRVAVIDNGRILIEEDPEHAVMAYGLHHLDFDYSGNIDQYAAALVRDDAVFSVTSDDAMLSITARLQDRALHFIEETVATGERYGVSLSIRNIHKPDLESLFLDITGRSLRDD